jgi:hypothetical protein
MSTPSILARNSGEGSVPYYKTGDESEGNNRPGSLVSITMKPHLIYKSEVHHLTEALKIFETQGI